MLDRNNQPRVKAEGRLHCRLKNLPLPVFISALKRDGFQLEVTRGGAVLSYRHPDGRRVPIHYHPNSALGRGLIEYLVGLARWTESDLERLGLAG
jgi:predicted RNA binding protein YcfA (HicA-like mRNA interferase family)